jgi:2,4-dienoyl-CoA reductase (NADPH2)
VLATGIIPRPLGIPGSNHPSVLSYLDLIEGRKVAGDKVAVVGAGGIGFDVAEFLTHAHNGASELERFQSEWGIDPALGGRGGLKVPTKETSPRQVWLLQRKVSKVGEGLAKTTGWIRRSLLKMRGVKMLAGVAYERIDDAGLHVVIDGQPQCLPVNTIVVCAGQEPRRELEADLRAAGVQVSLIGGADRAAELDAKRAIDQGTRLAAQL